MNTQELTVGDSPQTSSRERGATLIEAVLFSVVALGLVVGGITFFEQASLTARTNEALRLMASLPMHTRTLFQSQATFGTADIGQLLINARAVPVSLLRDTDDDDEFDTINNIFGGTITVEGATNQFTIEMTDMPVEVCSRLIAFDATGTGIIGGGIAGVSDGTANDTDGLTPAEAAEFCDANAAGGEVDITWTFDR